MANEFIIKNGFHSKGNSQITGSLSISGSDINLNNFSALKFSGTDTLNVGYANNWTQINIGKQSSDEIRVNGILKAEQDITASANMSASGYISASAFSGDGSGLTGVSPSPAGNNQEIQFNNSGVLGGNPNFKINNADGVVSMESGSYFGIGSEGIIKTTNSTIGINADEDTVNVEIIGEDGESRIKALGSGIQITGSTTIKDSVNITGPITASILKPLNQPGLSVTGTTLLVQGGDNTNGTGGNGGNLNLFGGKSRSQGNGGDVNIFGGDFNASGVSGSIFLDGTKVELNDTPLHTSTIKSQNGVVTMLQLNGNNVEIGNVTSTAGGPYLTKLFAQDVELFSIFPDSGTGRATLSGSRPGKESEIIATTGSFSRVTGRSSLIIDTGTDTLQIVSSNFGVATTGEMSSGTGDGISTTNITSSGNISSSGKFIGSELSSLGDLTLDADGADILLKDGGTEFGRFKRDSSNFVIKSATSDKDIIFRGDSGGGTVDSLTLDMSDGGKALFKGGAQITGSLLLSGSLQLDYNGNGNMIIGSGSGEALTTGTDNIIFGNNAAQGLDTGTDNIIIGKFAAKDVDVDDGANLVLIGKNVAANGTFTSEDDSVCIGTSAGQGAKLAGSVFIGHNAGASSGYNGVNQSVAVGGYALAQYGGNYNVAIGYKTLRYGYPGATIDNNIAIGYSAMEGNSAYAGPRNNIAIGFKAMQNTTTNINVGGGENIAIGYEAARPSDGTTKYFGTKNIVIGYQAGQNSYTTDATHNIIIGPSAALAFSGSSDTLVIASGSSHLISGSFATGDIIFYNTASAPNFSGSFQGDGSNLTGTGTVVVGNGGGSGDTLSQISIGGTTFEIPAGTVTPTNGASNRIATFNNATLINGEANLTFDGSALDVTGDVTASGDILIEGGGLDIKNGGAQSYARFYCESSNAHYTELKAQPHALYSGNPVTLLPSYDFDFRKPFFGDSSTTVNITASGAISASGNLIGNNLQSPGSLILGGGTFTSASLAQAVAGEGETYDLNATTNGSNVNLNLTSTSGTDNSFVTLKEGTNITLTRDSATQITIDAAGGGGGGGIFSQVGSTTQFSTTSSLLVTGSNSPASASLEVHGSGSNIFKVEGSVGTLFSVDDGLDDVIFAANNISGTPVISANVDNTVRLGKLGGFGIVISGSTPAPNDSQAKIIITGSIHTSGSLGIGMAASSTIGRIDAKNDVVAFSTSDERLKNNITPIENALDKVSQVQGIEFDWIPKEGVHGNEGHDVGVIAQEIEKVLPEVVQNRDNGYKAVKYEKIIPLLIEAIKELQAEVQELKKYK